MRFFLLLLLPLLSIATLIYTSFISSKSITLKIVFVILLELAGLILLNWSAHRILKLGSALGFITALLSLVVLFPTIRYLIINFKINKS